MYLHIGNKRARFEKQEPDYYFYIMQLIIYIYFIIYFKWYHTQWKVLRSYTCLSYCGILHQALIPKS